MRALNIAATGMLAQQLNVEVVSHNIANINTTGYKRQRAEFQDLLYQNLRRVGTNSTDSGTVVPSGIQLGLGVKTAAVYRITEQGSLVTTENNLDLAIEGEGYFQVEMPDGTIGYTRAGSFQLNAEGEIVTADGYRVEPGIAINPEATAVTINKSGEVSVKLSGNVAPQIVGQLQLATFANKAGLEAIGDNLFLESPASGPPNVGVPGNPGIGTIRQGFLENSNVNVVSELTNLITAQRAYEMNSRVIKTADDMYSSVTQLR
jgi:flagellar basal-body rod protein FlgG